MFSLILPSNISHFSLFNSSFFPQSLKFFLIFLRDSTEITIMEVRTVTPDAISKIIANPSPDFSVERPDLVVQVLDLKSVGNRFMSVSYSLSFSISCFMLLDLFFLIWGYSYFYHPSIRLKFCYFTHNFRFALLMRLTLFLLFRFDF